MLFVDCFLGFFDEREDVAHAEDARDDAVGMKRFERIVFFADACEFHRRARHFADGKRRAAARIAVELRQNDAGDAEALVKFSGGANGVLADHGVGDEENFGGREIALELRELVHQFVVDVQAAGGVDENYVAGGEFRFAHRAANNFERLVGARAGPAGSAGGFRDLRELLARGGAIDVGGNDERPVAVFAEPFAEFAGGGRFAGALQADDHPDGRRARSEKHFGFAAEEIAEFVANNFHDLLIGRKLQKNFGAEGLLANVRDDFVDDADVDVAFEERFADFGERGVEVLFGELALAAQIFECALEFFC